MSLALATTPEKQVLTLHWSRIRAGAVQVQVQVQVQVKVQVKVQVQVQMQLQVTTDQQRGGVCLLQ